MCCALKPSLPHEVPLGNDLMQQRTPSTSATRGGSEYIVPGIDGGSLYGCLASKACTVLSLYGATPDEHNTFTAAVKWPSATFRRHCLTLVLLTVLSSGLSTPP
ncbi:hypothetical protein HanIR_Chr09g0395821 [Helianthus annuus]|nr:hypothetical protein HanIR_Chr09g0395821 [Helianthus annuus]